jgi:hypothetical protein
MWISNSMHVFLHASGRQILRVSNTPIIALNPIDLTNFALSYDRARIYLAGPPIETIQHFLRTTRSQVYRGGAMIAEDLAALRSAIPPCRANFLKKSFSSVSSPIFACTALMSTSGVDGLALELVANTSAAPSSS